jgi:hypothetical protein
MNSKDSDHMLISVVKRKIFELFCKRPVSFINFQSVKLLSV